MNEALKIDVARLNEDGEVYEGELDGEKVIDIQDDFVHPFAGLRYNLFVQLFGTELVVKGRAEQDFDAICSRCGADFDFTVREEDLLFSQEITAETEFVDLTNELRESILLQLPRFPICREDCKGVCQQCGKNLNEGACECKHEEQPNCWGALDKVNLITTKTK